jgi:hypothetical protein
MLLTLPASSFMARLFAGRTRPRVTRWFAAHVRRGATRAIEPPPGCVTVHCREGEAWITHDGDPKDVMLQPKESYRVQRAERMHVHALHGDCVLEIQVEA